MDVIALLGMLLVSFDHIGVGDLIQVLKARCLST